MSHESQGAGGGTRGLEGGQEWEWDWGSNIGRSEHQVIEWGAVVGWRYWSDWREWRSSEWGGKEAKKGDIIASCTVCIWVYLNIFTCRVIVIILPFSSFSISSQCSLLLPITPIFLTDYHPSIVTSHSLPFAPFLQSQSHSWLPSDALVPPLTSSDSWLVIQTQTNSILYMYQLEPPAQWKIHDVFHVNVLSEATHDTILNCTNPAPPPVKVNDEHFWVMEKYLDSQWFWNWFQFKIWWEGFTEEHDMWENADNINSDTGPHLLQDGDVSCSVHSTI